MAYVAGHCKPSRVEFRQMRLWHGIFREHAACGARNGDGSGEPAAGACTAGASGATLLVAAPRDRQAAGQEGG